MQNSRAKVRLRAGRTEWVNALDARMQYSQHLVADELRDPITSLIQHVRIVILVIGLVLTRASIVVSGGESFEIRPVHCLQQAENETFQATFVVAKVTQLVIDASTDN